MSHQGGEDFAAIIVDLFLPDSRGIETFDKLFRASPHTPILIFSRVLDEDSARLALQRGAQDYLLAERLDDYSLSKAVTGMLQRSTYAEALFVEKERAQVTLNSIGDGVIGLTANCVLIRRDGYESAIEDTAAPIHDRRGHVTGAVIAFHDVSMARATSLRMSYLAQHDFLTGLPNRMLLNDRLMQAIAFALRHRTSLAVLGVCPDSGTDAEKLLKNADTALFNAKAQGRSRHQFYN